MKTKSKIPKGYKSSPLGIIPEDWQVASFGNVCERIMDGTHFSPTSTSGRYKYLTSKNIRNSGLDLSNTNYISAEEHKSIYSRCPVLFGDVLLTKDGAGTGCCCINTLKEEFSLLSSVAVLRANPRLTSNDYLIQFIKSPIGQTIILNQISGQAITRITLSKIKTFHIVLPTIEEQRRIEKVLNTCDNAIQVVTALTVQKLARKKWLMQHLLSGKIRLKGFNQKWKTFTYDQLLKEVKRPIEWNDSELYQLISVRRRSGGLFHRENLYGHQILTKGLRTAKAGDFLISKMQIVHGASGLTTKEFDGMKISGSYIAVVPKDKNVLNIEYFNWYSQRPHFYHQTLISSYGVHIEKMTFDFETFLSLGMKLPPIEEQNVISKTLDLASREIQILQGKLDKLNEQKKWLMQVLLTGKKRLKLDLK